MHRLRPSLNPFAFGFWTIEEAPTLARTLSYRVFVSLATRAARPTQAREIARLQLPKFRRNEPSMFRCKWLPCSHFSFFGFVICFLCL